ncbi:MAG: thiamine-phosphate kinase [Dehalococcoidia bacterium]|nr:thiamine-phosphate kinase [Dehalococcoidia bacterium]
MKISEIGEFGLIERLAAIAAKEHPQSTARKELYIGIGDDTAAWHNTNKLTLSTTDCLVQDVHFRLGQTTWHALGWKALAVNLSDIAAMGGAPECAFVTLGLPPDSEVCHIEELYRGLLDLARRHGVALAGGDISTSATLFINIALTGSAGTTLLKRSNAQAGDLIALTGFTGLAAAGLRLIERGSPPCPEDEPLRQAFWQPNPRLEEGCAILAAGAHAAIDISDGLVADLKHICCASGVSAKINLSDLPLHHVLEKFFGSETLDLALGGGEDYELLFTAKPNVMSCITETLKTPVFVIGTIEERVPGSVKLLHASGAEYKLQTPGWDHFV